MPIDFIIFLVCIIISVSFAPPLPSPNNNSNNEGGGQKQMESCKMMNVEQGESLFDTVPDEIVEKILAAASLTCQRFHSVIKAIDKAFEKAHALFADREKRYYYSIKRPPLASPPLPIYFARHGDSRRLMAYLLRESLDLDLAVVKCAIYAGHLHLLDSVYREWPSVGDFVLAHPSEPAKRRLSIGPLQANSTRLRLS